MTIEELQKQKDLTMETTENLKNVVDWNNIEAGEQALKAKDILLEEKDKEIAKVKNMYYRLHGEFTDTKQQLLSMTESKNRYQKEFMKANKTIVEHKERKEPENVFVDGLVSKIKMLKSTNSNPWQRNMK